ncbi:restriction endonuclease subunit S [Flavobacterium sp.]|uniref:restriction endonuclease subunit S n=1 Tax=Flavobacterium sp. TaxID=239 RepID=UPI0037518FDF
MIRLGDITTVTAGQAAPKDFSISGTPFIRAGHLEDLVSGKGLLQIPKVNEEIAKKNRLKKLPKGSILFAKSGMSAKKNRIYICEEDTYFVSHLAAILPSDNFDTNFLARYLNWYNPTNLILDDAYPSIRLEDINNLEIPLPNLSTQQKIAAILDKADELRQYNKQLIEKYDALMQSLFLNMFGDPVRNEKGWEICTFSQILSKIESGWSPVCENKPRVNDKEWAVLKLGSVSYGTYNPKENKKYEFDVPKTKQDCEVKKGDLLFTRKNTYHMVGTTVFVYETSPRLLLPDTVFRLLYRKEKASPIFLYYLLNHNKFIKEIQSLASGTSGSMPNISKAKLLAKETILPPINLQNQYAERVQLIETQKQKAQEALTKSEDLFQGLLQQAFKGEIN